MHLFVKQLRRITATAAICLLVQQLSAQTDTEFWFVAPEITSGHGDSPIVLRVSANELPADIVLSQPATNAFTPIVLTIPAGTTQTIDLTPFKDLLENQLTQRDQIFYGA